MGRMNLEHEEEPILNEYGLLCDPHQLRVLVHELCIMIAATVNNPTPTTLLQLRYAAALAHRVICEDDVMPTDAPAPQEVDPWQLFTEN